MHYLHFHSGLHASLALSRISYLIFAPSLRNLRIVLPPALRFMGLGSSSSGDFAAKWEKAKVAVENARDAASRREQDAVKEYPPVFDAGILRSMHCIRDNSCVVNFAATFMQEKVSKGIVCGLQKKWRSRLSKHCKSW